MTTHPSGAGHHDPNVDPFSADIDANAGYLYTTNARLSSRLANGRMTEAAMTVATFAGQTVIDIGCGDGTYTAELFLEGGAAVVHATDPSAEAVGVARSRTWERGAPVHFTVASAYRLPYPDDRFDIAHLRGVLHHMDDPVGALRESLRVARRVVVIEPNGYNPGLKVLERCSRYHVEHGEKSYAPRTLDRWVSGLGGRVDTRLWAGFVPMFCPDWAARITRRVQPVLERAPGLRAVGCAVYVFSAVRNRGAAVASRSR